MPDELGYSAAVMKFVLFRRLRAFVGQRDSEAFVQEGQFAQTRRQRVEIKVCGIHDGAIRLKRDLGTGFLARLASLRERPLRNALLIILFPSECLVPDLKVQRLRQRVDAAYAHSMQSARYFIAFRIELAARVQLGHHYFGCGNTKFFLDVGWDATPVIHYGE